MQWKDGGTLRRIRSQVAPSLCLPLTFVLLVLPAHASCLFSRSFTRRQQFAVFSLPTRAFRQRLIHTDVLEPVGAAVFLVQPGLAVGELAGVAALALGRVGACGLGTDIFGGATIST